MKDAHNLIKLPDSVPLDVGAILPCGALMAYCAVQRVKPFIEQRILADEHGAQSYTTACQIVSKSCLVEISILVLSSEYVNILYVF